MTYSQDRGIVELRLSISARRGAAVHRDVKFRWLPFEWSRAVRFVVHGIRVILAYKARIYWVATDSVRLLFAIVSILPLSRSVAQLAHHQLLRRVSLTHCLTNDLNLISAEYNASCTRFLCSCNRR
jgi:hypothetical protein